MGERELDRRLEAAAARSPELVAMLAGKRADPSVRYRRLVLLLGGAAAGLGALWLVLGSLAPGGRTAGGKPSEPAQEIDTSHYLTPIRTQAAGTGEEVAPFTGFALSVDTEPPGGVVTIRGVPRGEAPVLANVECRGGETIEVRAEKAGRRAAHQDIACRADTLVKVTLRLDE